VQERRFPEKLVSLIYIHQNLAAAFGETGYFNSALQDQVDAGRWFVLVIDDLTLPVLYDMGARQVS
jgi:hypothetical protein